ncbi:MAG: UvrD-helicase domain-containing protein [Saprospiraceae bacterium]|nr:UvrD-helicase domain-containing protein [Saprospiraceae bacterium]
MCLRVGDDDQAIYRFQGANVENMIAFDRLYAPSKNRVDRKLSFITTYFKCG